MRYLSDGDVVALLDWQLAVDALDAAFHGLAAGRAALTARMRLTSGQGKISSLLAALPDQGVVGGKIYSTTDKGRFRFLAALFDATDGTPLVLMEADTLTRMRTAATSLLAARLLAPTSPSVLAVFGSGVQARAHVEAFSTVWPGLEVRIISRGDDAAGGLAGADLVVLATRATEPLFDASLLRPGMHVTAVGATRPEARELSAAAVDRFDVVVAESAEHVRHEASELAGVASNDLGDVLTGRAHGRRGASDLTLFKSVGIALEDVAVAAAVYRAAVEAGLGVDL